MNKVMVGSLPARLWRDAMHIAYGGSGPSAPLSEAGPASIASLVAGSAQQPPEPRTSPAPLMPRERIGADFIERATSEADGPPSPRPTPGTSTGFGWFGKAR